MKVFLLTVLSIAIGCQEDGDMSRTQEPLPEYPGAEEARRTLAGVDSDGDFIRDDVQIMVRGLGLSLEQEKAVLQLARAMQMATITGSEAQASSDEVTSTGELLARGVDCVSYRFGDRAIEQIHVLNLLIADTPDRSIAYQNFEQRTHGQQFPSARSEAEACD